MADENFDPCECLWNHEVAMRRLISLLRSSQSYCTDNECINDIPGQMTPPQNESNMFFLMMMWAVLAVTLFFLRPQRRSTENVDQKPTDNHQGPGAPPPPAVN